MSMADRVLTLSCFHSCPSMSSMFYLPTGARVLLEPSSKNPAKTKTHPPARKPLILFSGLWRSANKCGYARSVGDKHGDSGPETGLHHRILLWRGLWSSHTHLLKEPWMRDSEISCEIIRFIDGDCNQGLSGSSPD